MLVHRMRKFEISSTIFVVYVGPMLRWSLDQFMFMHSKNFCFYLQIENNSKRGSRQPCEPCEACDQSCTFIVNKLMTTTMCLLTAQITEKKNFRENTTNPTICQCKTSLLIPHSHPLCCSKFLLYLLHDISIEFKTHFD